MAEETLLLGPVRVCSGSESLMDERELAAHTPLACMHKTYFNSKSTSHWSSWLHHSVYFLSVWWWMRETGCSLCWYCLSLSLYSGLGRTKTGPWQICAIRLTIWSFVIELWAEPQLSGHPLRLLLPTLINYYFGILILGIQNKSWWYINNQCHTGFKNKTKQKNVETLPIRSSINYQESE